MRSQWRSPPSKFGDRLPVRVCYVLTMDHVRVAPEHTEAPIALRREVIRPTSGRERLVVGLTIASLAMMMASVSAAILLRGTRRPAAGIVALPPEAQHWVNLELAASSSAPPSPPATSLLEPSPPIPTAEPRGHTHPPVAGYADAPRTWCKLPAGRFSETP